MQRFNVFTLLGVAFLATQVSLSAEVQAEHPWPAHIIDRQAAGADGVRLADVNNDGRLDVTVGFEEGDLTRAFLHPGVDEVKTPWPAVTVGGSPSVEDAVFADLDADGAMDVISCCEGGERKVIIHWAPSDAGDYLNADAWESSPITESVGRTMWMFCVPMDIDGKNGVDLVVGSKGGDAAIGWFESPRNPRELSKWKWHPMCKAGWIMSLKAIDMDADGDLDVLTTDRKGETRACKWLENPGVGGDVTAPWRQHILGGTDAENMFLTVGDLDNDGRDDILWATKRQGFTYLRGVVDADGNADWEEHKITMPRSDRIGGGKGVAIADVDLDGRNDLVVTCESAEAPRSGAVWLAFPGFPEGDNWTLHEISGPLGIKYDRIEMIDLDEDGDLDLMTCEERATFEGRGGGLGVFWYENPAR